MPANTLKERFSCSCRECGATFRQHRFLKVRINGRLMKLLYGGACSSTRCPIFVPKSSDKDKFAYLHEELSTRGIAID